MVDGAGRELQSGPSLPWAYDDMERTDMDVGPEWTDVVKTAWIK
jgi:hypothetical protein